jgi:hypothetical protein
MMNSLIKEYHINRGQNSSLKQSQVLVEHSGYFDNNQVEPSVPSVRFTQLRQTNPHGLSFRTESEKNDCVEVP